MSSAQDDDTIQFAASLAGETITLGSSLPDIVDSSLSIVGPSAAPVTINGTQAYTAFSIEANASAAISNLTITESHNEGVYCAGSLAITNCAISDSGDGISFVGSTLAVSDCNIQSNSGDGISFGPTGSGANYHQLNSLGKRGRHHFRGQRQRAPPEPSAAAKSKIIPATAFQSTGAGPARSTSPARRSRETSTGFSQSARPGTRPGSATCPDALSPETLATESTTTGLR